MFSATTLSYFPKEKKKKEKQFWKMGLGRTQSENPARCGIHAHDIPEKARRGDGEGPVDPSARLG